MKKYKGRRQPYTVIGIRRMACSRCGVKPSKYQWSSCANRNYFVPICEDCDIKLNNLVLHFFNFPNRKELMRDYLIKIGRGVRSVPPKKLVRVKKVRTKVRTWKRRPDRIGALS